MKFQMTSLWEARPSATYKNNVERDPPKQKPLPKNLTKRTKKGKRK